MVSEMQIWLYLGDARSQIGTHEKFEPFKLSLDDDETEIGLWIEVACLLLDELNLESSR